MLLSLKRIIMGGGVHFVRSGLVSYATVLIMTVTLTIIGSLIFLSAILSHTLVQIKDKVDVNVYFTTSASESDILYAKKKIEALPEVVNVAYTSRDQALVDFRTKHASDSLTLAALDQLGENPLGASLSIKAQDPSQYEGVVAFLSNNANLSNTGSAIVDRINYYQNKIVIDRLSHVIQATKNIGLGIIILFAFASIIIAFATIRLAIYSARDEISVMRLVGASNMYIRGPFIIAGIIGGVIASVITLLLFYAVAWYAGTHFSLWLGGFNLFSYYTDNFVRIFSILTGSGIILGGIASYVAVRKYLRV
jgi:cell division transport system permease protein